MERKFDLLLHQKKAQAGVSNKVSYLIGALIVVVMAVAIAPEIFTQLGDLTTSGAPAWVETVLIVVAGAGIVFLIWRAFGGK